MPGGRVVRGGIFRLIGDLRDPRTRAALRSDFRSRYGISTRDIGTKRCTWGEAVDLALVLREDPGSHYAAALHGWTYPFSRAEQLLAALIDTWSGQGAKPWPRPWDEAVKRRAARKARENGDITTTEAVDLLSKQMRGEIT